MADFGEQTKNIAKISKALAEQKKSLGDIGTLNEKINVNLSAQTKAYEGVADFLAIEKEHRQKALDAAERTLAQAQARGILAGDELKLARETLKIKQDLLEVGVDEEEQWRKKAKAAAVYRKELNKQQKAYEEAQSSLATIASRMGALVGIGERFSGTFVGGIITAGVNLVEMAASAEKSITDITKSLATNFADLATGFFLAISEEVMFMQDTLIAGFKKSTGATKEFGDSVYSASEGLREQALSMEAAGIAGAALFNTVTAYKDASGAARTETAIFVGTLEQLGINVDAAAELMQTLTQGLGMSLKQAMATEKGVIKLGRSMDMNLNEVITDFNELAPELAAHGENMTKVFEGLMKQSRKTGIEMQGLMSVAAQYDTFEGAAIAVGKLNGLLGGPYLNSIEMLYATEDERLQLLRESLILSGRQFDDLGRFEKKAVATAAGFNDVGEAAQFFNGQLDSPAARSGAKRQEDLAKIARDMQPVMEKLQLAVGRLAVSFKPLIVWVTELIEKFAQVDLASAKTFGKWAIATVVIGKLVGSLVAAAKALAALKFVMAGTAIATAGPIAAMAAGIAGLGFTLYHLKGAWDDMFGTMSKPIPAPVRAIAATAPAGRGAAAATPFAKTALATRTHHSPRSPAPSVDDMTNAFKSALASSSPAGPSTSTTVAPVILNGREIGELAVKTVTRHNNALFRDTAGTAA